MRHQVICRSEMGWAASVMINFMCQLDWAAGCPDIWPYVILGVSGRVDLDEINMKLVD